MTHDKTKVNDLMSASEMVLKFIELHYVGCSPKLKTIGPSPSLAEFTRWAASDRLCTHSYSKSNTRPTVPNPQIPPLAPPTFSVPRILGD